MGQIEAATPQGLDILEQVNQMKARKAALEQKWLGIFACFTVAWGLLSLFGLVVSMLATPEALSSYYTAEQVSYLSATPFWAMTGKAFTSCGLLVGAVYLLLRKASAYFWFMWSLVGTLMVMLDSAIRGGFHILGGMETGVNLAAMIVGIFIFWAAYTAVQEGQLQSE